MLPYFFHNYYCVNVICPQILEADQALTGGWGKHGISNQEGGAPKQYNSCLALTEFKILSFGYSLHLTNLRGIGITTRK